MISHTKQPSRLMVAVSAVIILTVAGLTFTRAHDTDEQRRSFTSRYDTGHQSLATPKLKKKVEVLRQQLDVYNKRILRLEDRMDTYREKGDINPDKGASSQEHVNAIREKLTDAEKDLVKWRSVYEEFQKMEQGELRYAIQVSYLKDELLIDLLERLHQFEQEKAKLLQEVTSEHPDLKEVESMIDTINRQINARVSGLMKGLKARVSSAKREVREFEQKLKELRAEDSESEKKARPYYRLQDRLKNIKRMRDSIHRKLMEAELELEVRRALRSSEDRGDGSAETKAEAE